MPQDDSAHVRLTGPQLERLFDAVRQSYPKYTDLKWCLKTKMEVEDTFVRSPASLDDQVRDVIEWAESEGRVEELVKALRACRPGNRSLAAVGQDILDRRGAGAVLDDAALEKIVTDNPDRFVNGAAWRQAMVEAEWKVCRVEDPAGTAWGTGFLVGPDLVLTNDHVARGTGGPGLNPKTAGVRFGARVTADGREEGGVFYPLDAGDKNRWLADESPADALDFALLRLKRPAGEEPVAAFRNAPKRKWIPLRECNAKPGQALFILQHPLGGVLKMAPGGVEGRRGSWLQYRVDTEHGSSGSPVFNVLWELVALHSRAGKGQVNEGVAITAICRALPEDLKPEVFAG
jgi:hypothetical protein